MFDKLLMPYHLAQIAQINRHLIEKSVYKYRHLVIGSREISFNEVTAEVCLNIQLIFIGRERINRKNIELLSKNKDHAIY